MSSTTTLRLTALVVLTTVLAACGAQGEAPVETAAAPPLTDDALTQDLPTNHPPIETPATADMANAQPPTGSEVGESGLRWQVPAAWEAQEPRSAMRRAQYRVPGEGGDAECVVFYFGPGQGGDPMSNAFRWADQFSQPDGSSSRDALVTETIEVGGRSVLLIEVSGTYSGGMAMMGGPTEELTGYLLLGGIAEGPDANWFFKLTGPEATVSENREAFRSLVESLDGGP